MSISFDSTGDKGNSNRFKSVSYVSNNNMNDTLLGTWTKMNAENKIWIHNSGKDNFDIMWVRCNIGLSTALAILYLYYLLGLRINKQLVKMKKAVFETNFKIWLCGNKCRVLRLFALPPLCCKIPLLLCLTFLLILVLLIFLITLKFYNLQRFPKCVNLIITEHFVDVLAILLNLPR